MVLMLDWLIKPDDRFVGLATKSKYYCFEQCEKLLNSVGFKSHPVAPIHGRLKTFPSRRTIARKTRLLDDRPACQPVHVRQPLCGVHARKEQEMAGLKFAATNAA